jgi:hypothetical protein
VVRVRLSKRPTAPHLNSLFKFLNKVRIKNTPMILWVFFIKKLHLTTLLICGIIILNYSGTSIQCLKQNFQP